MQHTRLDPLGHLQDKMIEKLHVLLGRHVSASLGWPKLFFDRSMQLFCGEKGLRLLLRCMKMKSKTCNLLRTKRECIMTALLLQCILLTADATGITAVARLLDPVGDMTGITAVARLLDPVGDMTGITAVARLLDPVGDMTGITAVARLLDPVGDMTGITAVAHPLHLAEKHLHDLGIEFQKSWS